MIDYYATTHFVLSTFIKNVVQCGNPDMIFNKNQKSNNHQLIKELQSCT